MVNVENATRSPLIVKAESDVRLQLYQPCRHVNAKFGSWAALHEPLSWRTMRSAEGWGTDGLGKPVQPGLGSSGTIVLLRQLEVNVSIWLVYC